MLPLETVALSCGVLGICVKFFRRKLYEKAKKHDGIRMIAESKLNSVKDLISRAITHGQTSQEEFKLIFAEIEKYKNLKDQIHSKQAGVSGVRARGVERR